VLVSYKSNKGIRLTKLLSNILSPHWPKSGGQKIFLARSARKIVPPHFQNRGAVHDNNVYGSGGYCRLCFDVIKVSK